MDFFDRDLAESNLDKMIARALTAEQSGDQKTADFFWAKAESVQRRLDEHA